MLILMPFATAVPAETPMTAAEFDAYTRDNTFYYARQGQAYGAEEYLSSRRVIWSFLDGNCQNGRWYEENGHICFVYDNLPDPQCWSFRDSSKGLIAKFENDPSQAELYEVRKSPEPLTCLGPEIGA